MRWSANGASLVLRLIQMVHSYIHPSCPDLIRASTETGMRVPLSVDGRDKPGHDEVNLPSGSEHQVRNPDLDLIKQVKQAVAGDARSATRRARGAEPARSPS